MNPPGPRGGRRQVFEPHEAQLSGARPCSEAVPSVAAARRAAILRGSAVGGRRPPRGHAYSGGALTPIITAACRRASFRSTRDPGASTPPLFSSAFKRRCSQQVPQVRRAMLPAGLCCPCPCPCQRRPSSEEAAVWAESSVEALGGEAPLVRASAVEVPTWPLSVLMPCFLPAFLLPRSAVEEYNGALRDGVNHGRATPVRL